MSPLKFILMPIGSAGDVLPMVWLGRLLRERGHEVVFLAQEMVREMPERAGLPTIAWGSAAEQEAILRNPDIWHPRKAVQLVLEFSAKWARQSIAALEPQVDQGRTVIIAGALAFGARVFSEARGVPLITMQLQPTVFMSVDDSPVMMAHGEWLPRAPRWVRRASFGLANWQVDRMLGPAVAALRREMGVPGSGGKMKGVMRHYWHSPDGVLCLFPEWFSPPAADWPRQAMLLRFPHYDEDDTRPLEPALAEFLERHTAEGARPVVITPGSANAHAERFLREAAEACRRLNRAAVVVTRFPEQAPPVRAATLGAELMVTRYAPFSLLFPRAAAVLHHGGVGTTSQCFAAGVPQLIMPLAHDQPDNAARVKRMGAGDYLYPRAFTAGRIAPVLSRIMASQSVREHCLALQQKCRQQMPDARAAEILESLATRALAARHGGVVTVKG